MQRQTSNRPGNDNVWTVELDTSNLPPGQAYRLRVNLDGLPNESLTFGESGQMPRISGIGSVGKTGVAELWHEA